MKELIWILLGIGIAYVLWSVLRNGGLTRTVATTPVVSTPIITTTPQPAFRPIITTF